MTSWWQGLLLGVVQGLTEFLPVSSSGHLVLAQSLLPGFNQPGVLFDVALHVATAAAVVLYFYRDLPGLLKRGSKAEEMAESGQMARIEWKLAWVMILALISTGIIGFLLKDFAEAQFQNPLAVGYFLILTGALLVSADWAARRKPGAGLEPNSWRAVLIGSAQGLAVFPGLSRSGATIATGIFTGVRGDYAARFSFLLSVPAVLGASLVSLRDERAALAAFSRSEILTYVLGMAAAFGVGYFSIRLVFAVVRKLRLSWFGGYCVLLGLLTVIMWNLNK